MKTVLILCGGRSDEHEISLISAKCVLDAIDRGRFTPVLVGISKSGVWYLEDEKDFFRGEFRADQIRLNEDADRITITPNLLPNGRARIEAGGRIIEFDTVFPIIHGPFGEGMLQGFFDVVGVPYVGCSGESSWIGMDKLLTKILCQNAGLRVADFVVIRDVAELAGKETEIRRLGDTLFVKASRQGSSVGVYKVTSRAELKTAVEKALQYDHKCLIEQGISGREIECSVLGLNRSARASLPGEIIPAKEIGWYSYEAKYLLADGAKTLAPAPLDATTTKQIQEFALNVFNILECDGMARIDMFLEPSGAICLNEINTIPGFTPISMYPKMWEVSGVSYQALITELIDLAFQRFQRQ